MPKIKTETVGRYLKKMTITPVRQSEPNKAKSKTRSVSLGDACLWDEDKIFSIIVYLV